MMRWLFAVLLGALLIAGCRSAQDTDQPETGDAETQELDALTEKLRSLDQQREDLRAETEALETEVERLQEENVRLAAEREEAVADAESYAAELEALEELLAWEPEYVPPNPAAVRLAMRELLLDIGRARWRIDDEELDKLVATYFEMHEEAWHDGADANARFLNWFYEDAYAAEIEGREQREEQQRSPDFSEMLDSMREQIRRGY